jgi:cystathionine gamma-synthase
MHSGTKYLGGHSDALLGVATTSPWTERGKQLAEPLRTTQIATGGVASVMDSWLVLRGIRTLNLRVQEQSKTALRVAEYLQSQSSFLLVTAVHYPGLASHPQHEIAKRQMKILSQENDNGEGEGVSMFGGVLSVEFEDEVAATAFAGALQTIQRATSLGGTETLIEHRASIEPPGRVTSPPGLLRISVGLEDVNDLIHDLERALSIVESVVGGTLK